MSVNDKMSEFFQKAKAETEVLGIESKRKAALNYSISQIRSAEQMLFSVYKEIGKKVFLNRDDLTNAPIQNDLLEAERLYDSIKALNEEIAQTNRAFDLQVEAVRSQAYPIFEQTVMQCCKCGFVNKEQAAFCANCGKPIHCVSSDALDEQEIKVCTNCNEKNDSANVFCRNCGAKLERI